MKTKPAIRQSLLVLRAILLVATMSSVSPLRAAAPLWDNLPIGGGGCVTGVYADPNVSKLFYFRTDVGGAYRSDPTASYWIPITDGFGASNNFGIQSLAVDPNHGSTLYVLTGEYTGSTPLLKKSIDAGNTWTSCTIPTGLQSNSNGYLHARGGDELAVDPNNSSVLYLASYSLGLWENTTGGTSAWVKVAGFPSGVTGDTGYGLTFVVFDKGGGTTGGVSNIIYVGVWAAMGTTGGVYKSTNAGSSWAKMTATGATPMNAPINAAVASDGTLYVAFYGAPSVGLGAIGTAGRAATAFTDITPNTAIRYIAMTVDPTNPAQIYTAQYGGNNPYLIYSSSNGGTSWTAVGEAQGVQHLATRNGAQWFGSIAAIALDPFNHYSAWMGDGLGILQASNISSVTSTTPWNYIWDGDEETCPLNIVSPPSGPFLIDAMADVSGECHLSLTTPPAQSFQQESLPYSYAASTSIDFCESNPSVMARVVDNFVAGVINGLYSTNAGASWTYFATEPSGATGGRIAVSATNSSNFVWTAENGKTYYTTTSGGTWTQATTAPNSLAYGAEWDWPQANGLASDRVNGNFYMFGWTSGIGYLYVSTDGGATWTKSTGSMGSVGTAPTQFKVFARPGTANEVWVDVGYANTYVTTNAGASFTWNPCKSLGLMAYGAPPTPGGIPALFLDGSTSSSGPAGIFRSDDDGGSWHEIDNPTSPVANQNFNLGADRQSYGRCYIGTNGRGIFYNNLLLAGWADADFNSPTDKGAGIFDGTIYTVVGGGAGVGEPATLVEDQLNDGGVTNGSDPLDVNWANLYSSPLTLSVGPFAASGNTTNSLVVTTTGPWGMIEGGTYTSQALNIGDSITLSHDFRATSITIPSYGSTFRFGLGSSSNTYGFLFGSGTSTGAGFNVYSVNELNGTATVLTTTGTPIAINDNNPHSFDMTITRTATNTLSLSATVDGIHTFTATQTGVTNFTFDRVILGQGSSNINFNMDNVNVVVGLEQDQFNFVSEAAATSQTISADLSSETNPNSDARGGVMFRDGTATNAPMVEVVSTTGGIVSMSWRTTAGGSYNYIHAPGLFTTPPWVKLSRSGATFTGYYSTNGTTWTTIGTASDTFTSGSPEVGMLASSQNNAQAEVANLTNVSVTTP